ncbi:MAG: polymorphic toxin-type HINT domain-containing protein [Pirellulales bacterium]
MVSPSSRRVLLRASAVVGGLAISAFAAAPVVAVDAPFGQPEPAAVVWRGKTSTVEEVQAEAANSSSLRQYLAMRERIQPSTPEHHFQLAQWCGKNGLKDEQRAHLTAVVDKLPSHALARAGLGQRLVDGRWITSEDVRREAADKRADAAARGRWEAKLRKLADEAKSVDSERQQRALAELRGVNDVHVVPYLESCLSRSGDPLTGRAVIDALQSMPETEATLSLARHALYHVSPAVRTAAAEALKLRKPLEFVPGLLAEMFTLTESRAVVTPTANGFVVVNTLSREGEGESQVATTRTVINVPRNDDEGLAAREARDRAQRAASKFDLEVELRNQQTRQTNERVCAALAMVFPNDLPAQPEAWWHWWNERNDLWIAEKPTRRADSTETIYIPRPVRPFKCECLAAGTEVLTIRGPAAVETLQIGDLLLSRHPDTGAMAYKPVLATTIRPPNRLMYFKTVRGEYRTSGGHPFLLVEQGWKKARDLKTGDRFVGLEGDVEVLHVTQAEEAPTYNVIVADYHTYFAGPGKIASWDNTLCAPLVNARDDSE